jgi:hypothetical protein
VRNHSLAVIACRGGCVGRVGSHRQLGIDLGHDRRGRFYALDDSFAALVGVIDRFGSGFALECQLHASEVFEILGRPVAGCYVFVDADLGSRVGRAHDLANDLDLARAFSQAEYRLHPDGELLELDVHRIES